MDTKTQNEQIIRVITPKNMPTRIPFWQTIVVFLFFDRYFSGYSWSNYVLGFVVGMTVIAWLTIGYKIYKEKYIDVFEYIEIVRQKTINKNMMSSTYEKMLKK